VMELLRGKPIEADEEILRCLFGVWFLKRALSGSNLENIFKVGHENEPLVLNNLAEFLQFNSSRYLLRFVRTIGLIRNKRAPYVATSVDSVCTLQLEDDSVGICVPVEIKTVVVNKNYDMYKSVATEHGCCIHMSVTDPLIHSVILNRSYLCQIIHHAAVMECDEVLFVRAAKYGCIIYTVLVEVPSEIRERLLKWYEGFVGHWLRPLHEPNPTLPPFPEELDYGIAKDRQTVELHFEIGTAMRSWIRENKKPFPDCKRIRHCLPCWWSRVDGVIDVLAVSIC